MATMTTGGTDVVLGQLKRLEKDCEAQCRRAVKAGAAVVVEQLKGAAPVRTGGLRDSIKASAIKYDSANGYYSRVEPTGNHPDTDEPYAKIGNILEYGRSNMPGRPWFHPTVAAAEQAALAAMEQAAHEGS